MARSNRKSNRNSSARPVGRPVVSSAQPVDRVVERDATDAGAKPIANVETFAPSTPGQPPTPAETHSLPETSVTERLDQLAEMIGRLDGKLTNLSVSSGMRIEDSADEHREAMRAELERLKDRLDAAAAANHELRQQNEDLAAQLAQSGVRQTVRRDSAIDETMTWEQRKELIFQQMETDSFDAEAFVAQLPTVNPSSGAIASELAVSIGPIEFVREVTDHLRQAELLAERRGEELAELRILLHQQAEDRQAGVVVGAAAIAGMFDSDELVQQERERLQALQAEWEDKFRQAEIAASLERAKLARERQELARRTAEVEEKLEDMQRHQVQKTEPDRGSRRWLAELGLGSRS